MGKTQSLEVALTDFLKNLYFFFSFFLFHDYIARFACNDRDTRIRKNSHEMAKLVSALAIIALLLSLQEMSEGGGPNPIYPKPKRRQQMKGEIEWGNWRSMSDRYRTYQQPEQEVPEVPEEVPWDNL